MKLLYCPLCHDVMGLIQQEWRTCLCGASGGQYNADGMTATIGGRVRIFGVGNPFFNELYPYLESEGKRKMRVDMYGQPDTDAWWGEYEGDQQLFRIAKGTGPRLKVKVENLEGPMMNVAIMDKRDYTVAGVKNAPYVNVPKNPMMQKITRWQKKKKVIAKECPRCGHMEKQVPCGFRECGCVHPWHKKRVKPKTLFLNEQHETHLKKGGK